VVTIASLAYAGRLPVAGLAVSPWDLVCHAVLIGLMGMLLDGALGFRRLTRGSPGWLRLGPAIVIALAGAEEILQLLSSRRSASVWDFAADVVGVLVLSALARFVAFRVS
jgi:VanZ family protein